MSDDTKTNDPTRGETGAALDGTDSASSASAAYLKEERRRAAKDKQRAAEEEVRKERASAKLRENLSRRKQQLRARRAGDADETTGLPAAKTDESS